MKKILFLSLITPIIASTTSAQPNKLQEDVRKLFEETNKLHKQNIEKDSGLINQLEPTKGWLFTYHDEKQKALQKKPETTERLCELYSAGTQVIGIDSCLKCINEIPNPTTGNLNICYKKWIESDLFKTLLKSAEQVEQERLAHNGHTLENAVHNGNHILYENIRRIIKENSQEQQ